MRKILLSILILFLLVGSVYAVDTVQQYAAQGKVLCNTEVTAAAACATPGNDPETIIEDINVLVGHGTCHITTSGAAPTTMVVSLLASANCITYGLVSIDGAATTHTYTAASASSTNTFSWSGQYARCFTGYFSSKTGGDATSALTLSCDFGGN